MDILIAEDELVSRMVLRKTLTAWGYQVTAVDNGAKALEHLLREDGPKIAVLDWEMPGLTGPEVCAKVRASGVEPYPFLVLLTSRNDTIDLVEGMDAGADDFLAKPFVREELLARLKAGGRIMDLQSELINAREQLRRQATTDALTGVLNRRMVLDRLEQELSRTMRSPPRSVGVVLIDLDHFKRVNYTWGHNAGDAVLVEASRRMSEALRTYDQLGRYGGEEFLAVVPDIDERALRAVAERLRHALEESPVRFDGEEIPVTASMGIHIAHHRVQPERLIGMADAALYRSKANGRNQVTAAWTDEAVAARKAA